MIPGLLIYIKKSKSKLIINSLMFSIIILILLVNINQNNINSFDNNVWMNNISDVKISNLSIYNNTLTEFKILNGINEKIPINSFIHLELDNDFIYFNKTQNKFRYTNNESYPFLINDIIFVLELSNKFIERDDLIKSFVSENPKFILFNNSTNSNEISDGFNCSIKLLNHFEKESKGLVSGTLNSLLLLNSEILPIDILQVISSSKIKITRIDFWDLPEEYPHKLDSLYTYVNSIDTKLSRKLISFYYTEKNIDIVINNHLSSNISSIQFRNTINTMILLIFSITLLFYNTYVLNKDIISNDEKFINLIKTQLLRGITPNKIFSQIMIYELCVGIIQNSLSLLIILIVNFSFINYFLLLLLIYLLFLIINILFNLRKALVTINSINTLTKTKHKFQGMKKIYEYPIYFIIIPLLFVLFSIITNFQVDLFENRIFVILSHIYLILLIYNISIGISFPILDKIFLKHDYVKTQVIRLFKKYINPNWYIKLFLLTVIITTAFMVNEQLQSYTHFAEDNYNPGDIYLEDISKEDILKLSKAPGVGPQIQINHTLIQYEYISDEIKSYIQVGIYQIDLTNISNLLSDYYLEKSIYNMTLYENMPESGSIMSNSLFNLLDIQMGEEYSITDTNIDISLSYVLNIFPGVIHKNWIVINTKHKLPNQLAKSTTFDWFAKLIDADIFWTWFDDNIGYSQIRISDFTYMEIINPNEYIFLEIVSTFAKLSILIQLMLFLTYINLLFSFQSQNSQMIQKSLTSIIILIRRGINLSQLKKYYYRDVRNTLTSIILGIYPLLILSFLPIYYTLSILLQDYKIGINIYPYIGIIIPVIYYIIISFFETHSKVKKIEKIIRN